jgi:hypothetical protein
MAQNQYFTSVNLVSTDRYFLKNRKVLDSSKILGRFLLVGLCFKWKFDVAELVKSSSRGGQSKVLTTSATVPQLEALYDFGKSSHVAYRNVNFCQNRLIWFSLRLPVRRLTSSPFWVKTYVGLRRTLYFRQRLCWLRPMDWIGNPCCLSAATASLPGLHPRQPLAEKYNNRPELKSSSTILS